MSTPFVSCRRSGFWIPAAALATVVAFLLVLSIVPFLYFALFWALDWFAHVSRPWPHWIGYIVIALFTLLLILTWILEEDVPSMVMTVLRNVPQTVAGSIFYLQDIVLERFGRHLEQPIPIFCIRFRLDEALIALNVSRLLVKPIRILTVAAACTVTIALLPCLLLAIKFGPIAAIIFIPSIAKDVAPLLGVLSWTLLYSASLTILSFLIWTLLGY